MGCSCHGVSLFYEMLSISREVRDFQCEGDNESYSEEFLVEGKI